MRIVKALCFFSFILIIYAEMYPCTTAVVSGKYTEDGRPLLWKHRDTGVEDVKLMFFDDGDYSYIGLINTEDSLGQEVWAGTNSAGFSIINSASYNLKAEETDLKDQEGILMKRSLQQCRNLSEFESLLIETSGQRGIEANFGVIDVYGGAAYYECDDTSYVKYDANDPGIAPFGYIIRTNYSFSKNIHQGYGYIRFQTADNLFYEAAAQGKLTASFILKDCDRDLYHSLTKTDLKKRPFSKSKSSSDFVAFEDYINRFSSVSSTVVQGVKINEEPLQTTLWTILGFPLCSVAIPTWVHAGESLPEVMTAPGGQNAPLCDKAVSLKNQCFPISRGSGKKYLNRAVLFNQQGDGVLQLLPKLEEKILASAILKQDRWRSQDMDISEIRKYYKWIDVEVTNGYREYFGL